jgi:hypothetical protein
VRHERLSRRRSRLGAGAALVVAAAAAAAGCGSSGSSALTVPQGLSGRQASAYVSAQYNIEDREAKSALAPKPGSFLYGKRTVSVLSSTTPADGDINPYAIWPVSITVGSVRAGDVLVDNFNNKSNDQGTGTTIVNVHPTGKTTVFAKLPRSISGCPGGVGLTTAMVQLETGWVIVGSLPSANGKTATAGRGCLIVLSATGQLVKTIAGSQIDGPWDATAKDDGNSAQLFVTNTLVGIKGNGLPGVSEGDVVRLTLSQSVNTPPSVTAEKVIADDLRERGDPSSFVKGPTGLALSSSGTLYVADTLGDGIVTIPQALTRAGPTAGTTVTSGGQLANPLGMTVAPNGDLLVANSVNGKVVEVTPGGEQVGEFYAIPDVGQDPPGNGDLFDLAINHAHTGVLLVNDGTNTLELLH